MGFFSNIFRPRPQPAKTLVQAIERLQMTLLAKLTAHYSTRFPPSEALKLANGVLTFTMCIDPLGEDARKYGEEHSQLVRDEACRLADDPEVAEGFSYLYAALTIHIAIQTRSPFSEPAVLLGNRATELAIYIPNPIEICGSSDGNEVVKAISAFAESYMRDNRPNSPN